jgi:hypothetical protein
VASKRDLAAAREELTAARAVNLRAAKGAPALVQRLFDAEAATTLLKTGVSFDPGAFGLKKATLRSAEAARDRAEAELKELDALTEPYASSAVRRLVGALAILQADRVADHITDGRILRDEARVLYPCVAHIAGNVLPKLPTVFTARNVLNSLLQVYAGRKKPDDLALVNAILRASDRLLTLLEELRWTVGDTIYYPFEHAQEDLTLARYALPRTFPPNDDVVDVLSTADLALDRVLGLYHRALGRLTVACEEVERALGLPPIEVEPDEPAADASN